MVPLPGLLDLPMPRNKSLQISKKWQKETFLRRDHGCSETDKSVGLSEEIGLLRHLEGKIYVISVTPRQN